MKMMKILVVIALIMGLGVMPASADYKKKEKCDYKFWILSQGFVKHAFGWWKLPDSKALVKMNVDKKGVWAQANSLGFYKTQKLHLKVNQLIPPGQCKKYNDKFNFRVDFTATSKIFPGATDTAKQIIYQDCCRPADKKLKQDFVTKKPYKKGPDDGKKEKR